MAGRRHEIELNYANQYTINPNTLHRFQAGDKGSVVSEFSTRNTDKNGVLTDGEIHRITKMAV